MTFFSDKEFFSDKILFPQKIVSICTAEIQPGPMEGETNTISTVYRKNQCCSGFLEPGEKDKKHP